MLNTLNSILSLLVAALVCTAMGTAALAVNEIVLFEDDFESIVTPPAAPNNGALPGFWTGDPDTVGHNAVGPVESVASYAGSPPASGSNPGSGQNPGPVSGSNYLLWQRFAPTPHSGFFAGGAQFDAPVDSYFIHAEWQMYVEGPSTAGSGTPSKGSQFLQINLGNNGSSSANSLLRFFPRDIDGGPLGNDLMIVTNFATSGAIDTGFDITYDTYQTWEVDYSFFSNQYTLTIDGTVLGPYTGNPAVTEANGVWFRGGDLLRAWIDDVRIVQTPEPATMTLLGLGGLLLLKRRR